MGFFDKFKKENKAYTKPKKSGGHGSHWDVISGSHDELMSIVFSPVKNPLSMESIKRDSQDINAYFSHGDHLRTCTITVGGKVGEVYTAYPFIADGIDHEVILGEVDEWANGLEAQVHCKLGEASIAFFDTLYVKNKGTYEEGKAYTFSLSALAYRFFKATPKTFKDRDGRELNTKGMAGYFPFKDGDIDDFMFSTVVKEAIEFNFLDKDFFRVKAPLFRMDFGKGMEDVDVYIYTLKASTNGYVPKVGDDVTGILWLQGYKR